jgi:hypothetical protein
MRIILLDAHDQQYENYWKLAEPGRRIYCTKHGYEMICYRFGKLDPPERQPNWGRVQGILHHLTDCDWLMYLDTDTVIMNEEIRVESFIDDDYHLIAGPLPTESHAMTSAMLIRNCEWSFDFFRTLYDQTFFISHPYDPKAHEPYDLDHHASAGKVASYFEQSAFQYLYDKVDKYYSKIKLVTGARFNTNIHTYKPGDFLIHLCGRVRDRMKLMRLCVDGKVEEAKHQAARVDTWVYHPVKVIGR